jgi:hypothetical protein
MPALSANILVLLILGIIGLVLLILYFRSLAQLREAEGWPAIQGTVVESWVRRSETTDSDGSTTYHYYPEIHYRYQLIGSEYQGNRISFGLKRGLNRPAAEKVVAKYPVGANVMIYYQPDKPDNAILERSVSRAPLVMGIGFILAGIFFYFRWG